MRKLLTAALSVALAVSPVVPAYAHGGGGGGGHGGGGHSGGGYYVYVPGGGGGPMIPFAQSGDYSRIHSVAVISAIGQTMTLGSAALLREHSSFGIADWNMDQTVETIIAHHLEGRYTVKDVPRDRTAVARIPNGHYDTTSAKALQAYLLSLSAKDVDAFIVVRPDAENGSPLTPGLSLDADAGYARPLEIADFEIDVVDAQTGRIIARAFSRAQVRQGVAPQFAVVYGPSDLKLTSKDTPTDAQRAKMKTEFERLVSMSLRETLRALNLGIALPTIGARNLVPIPPEKNPYRKISKVMVISAIGDRLELDHRGTWFEHTDSMVPVAEWNLDAEFEKRVTDALDKHFTPTSVPVDRAKLAAVTLDPKSATLANPVDGIAPGADLDLYIVLIKLKGPVPAVIDDVAGLGMWNQTPFGEEYTQAFANYLIALVDPKTAKIARLYLGVSSPAYPSQTPVRKTSNANWPKGGGAFAPDQSSSMRAVFSEMMGDSIDETLLRMVLTGKMAAAGEDDLAAAPNETAAGSPPTAPAANAAPPPH